MARFVAQVPLRWTDRMAAFDLDAHRPRRLTAAGRAFRWRWEP